MIGTPTRQSTFETGHCLFSEAIQDGKVFLQSLLEGRIPLLRWGEYVKEILALNLGDNDMESKEQVRVWKFWKWSFWVEDGLFLKRDRAGIFEGTEKNAQAELDRRIEQMRPPFVRHGFDL